MARIWRDGQTQACFIYRLLACASIDEKIFQRQLRKQEISLTVADKKKDIASAFQSDDLRRLFEFKQVATCDTLELLTDGTATKPKSNDKSSQSASAALKSESSNTDSEVEKSGDVQDIVIGSLCWQACCNVKKVEDAVLNSQSASLIQCVFTRRSDSKDEALMAQLMAEQRQKEEARFKQEDEAEAEAEAAAQVATPSSTNKTKSSPNSAMSPNESHKRSSNNESASDEPAPSARHSAAQTASKNCTGRRGRIQDPEESSEQEADFDLPMQAERSTSAASTSDSSARQTDSPQQQQQLHQQQSPQDDNSKKRKTAETTKSKSNADSNSKRHCNSRRQSDDSSISASAPTGGSSIGCDAPSEIGHEPLLTRALEMSDGLSEVDLMPASDHESSVQHRVDPRLSHAAQSAAAVSDCRSNSDKEDEEDMLQSALAGHTHAT